ncbi:MAG: fibronectin type III domain-containing protein [Clostridia bacterium]|nr:fibronectin type III domain-containing protein [Clostridia bacterium]
MKKTVTLFFSMLILLAVLIPGTAAHAASSSNKTQVFQYLIQKLGFNSAATCGIMANIEHESEFQPNLVIRDANGLPSGGLCQWNGGRFTNLRNFCNNRGYDYLSIEGQLEYLKYELQKDSFKHIYKYLKEVPNNKEGAYNAAHYWCYYFEIPRNRVRQAAARGNAAAEKYWPAFRYVPITEVALKSDADGKTLDLDDVATVRWKAVKGSVTGYLVRLAEKENGSFNWDKAQSCTLPASSKGIDFKLSDLKPGRYAVRVCGVNGLYGVQGGCDNAIKFDVACLTHEYDLKKEKLPTFEKDGKRIYTCAECGEKKVVALKKLTEAGYARRTVQDFAVTDTAATAATLTWDPVSVANGYRIWQKVDDAWVKLKTLSAKATSFRVQGLDSNSPYAFRIASFVKNGEENVFSAPQELALTTRPAGTSLIEAAAKSGGKVSLKWERVKGVDGYIIYLADDPAGEMREVASVGSWWPFVTLRDLGDGTRCYFCVRSYVDTDNGRVLSAPSNVRRATAK